jgi:hypothetical protein
MNTVIPEHNPQQSMCHNIELIRPENLHNDAVDDALSAGDTLASICGMHSSGLGDSIKVFHCVEFSRFTGRG